MLKRIVCVLLCLLVPACLAEGAVEEKIDVLRSLDIAISDELAERTAAALAEAGERFARYGVTYDFTDYESILSYIGSGGGDYDRETWEIIPLTDDVYAFDAEMIDIDTGYRELLHAVERLSGGRIAIEGFATEISEELFMKGYGRFPIRFRLNGEDCVYRAKLENDWMDLGILDFLNGKIAEADPENRLWFMYDNGQGEIVFYRDAAWAKRFMEATGRRLSVTQGSNGPMDDIIDGLMGFLFR